MTTEIADKRIHAGKPMWPSLQTADWLFSAPNIALIVGLALTVVATIGAVWMANVRDGYLKRELSEANTRIAESAVRIEVSRAEAASASARAMAAQLELTKLKLPRTLDDAQSVYLIGILKPFAGLSIFMRASAADAEAVGLASQLRSILAMAGWNVLIWGAPDTTIEGASGILIELIKGADEKNQTAAVAIRAGLISAGIQVPNDLRIANIGNPTAWIRLTVGRKPI